MSRTKRDEFALFNGSLQEQANNRRNNITLTVGGITDTLANWSRKTGIGQKTIMYRIKNGWSDEQALSTTPSKANKLEKL